MGAVDSSVENGNGLRGGGLPCRAVVQCTNLVRKGGAWSGFCAGAREEPGQRCAARVRVLHQLNRDRSRFTTTNAQRGNTTLAAGLLQGVDQSDDQA